MLTSGRSNLITAGDFSLRMRLLPTIVFQRPVSFPLLRIVCVNALHSRDGLSWTGLVGVTQPDSLGAQPWKISGLRSAGAGSVSRITCAFIYLQELNGKRYRNIRGEH